MTSWCKGMEQPFWNLCSFNIFFFSILFIYNKITFWFIVLFYKVKPCTICFLFTVVSWLPVSLIEQVTGPRATTVNMIHTIHLYFFVLEILKPLTWTCPRKRRTNCLTFKFELNLNQLLHYLGFEARKHVFGVCKQQGADQPAHLRRLISDFVIHLLEIIISKLASNKFSIF